MSGVRILHVDDEPDIREIVDISLGLNPDFEVRACSSGTEAVAAATDWSPFLILLDVMMSGMDGPATLALLHGNPQTSTIPVLFMTARAQTREVEHLITLGAQGVISKPFDPMTLASLVRSHLQAIPLSTLRVIFAQRAKTDAALLKPYCSRLAENLDAASVGRVRQIAESLAGAADLVGDGDIAKAADAVVQAAGAAHDGADAPPELGHALAHLVVRLDNDWTELSTAVV